MPIVQISKIIHRTGSNADLPQLDVGEFGFATDDRKLYIGNDPLLFPPSVDPTTQTEVLTDASIGVSAPTGPTSIGSKGQIAYDDDYIYICVDKNTWIRALRDSW